MKRVLYWVFSDSTLEFGSVPAVHRDFRLGIRYGNQIHLQRCMLRAADAFQPSSPVLAMLLVALLKATPGQFSVNLCSLY